MGLRLRIILPFIALFTVVTAVTVAAILAVVTGSVERRLKDQVRSLSEIVAGAPGAIYQASYAGPLRAVYRADLAVFKDRQPTGLTSLPPSAAEALSREAFWPPEDTFVPWNGYLAVRHGESFLFYPLDILEREKREGIRPILAIAAAGLALTALFGFGIAHSVSRPLERLAGLARNLAPAGEARLPETGGGPELSHLVEALNRMLDSLRRAERLAALGRFAAGVAHEIKNPLTAMKMTVQMLREERAGSEREPFDLLLREIDRLDLAASELSAGARTSPAAKVPVPIDQAVLDVLDLLKPQLDHLGIRIDRRIQPIPPVPADPNRLKRAVMNLVLNGAQAMPQGGTLRVSLEAVNGVARFAVQDSGKGIAADLKDRIFEPFVTGRPDGVGLGLALTRQIVEDHGGTIGFDSSEAGSRFWIDLPSA